MADEKVTCVIVVIRDDAGKIEITRSDFRIDGARLVVPDLPCGEIQRMSFFSGGEYLVGFRPNNDYQKTQLDKDG